MIRLKWTLGACAVGLSTYIAFNSATTQADVPHQTAPIINLVVGGQPDKSELESLANQGYVSVINLRRNGEFDDFDEAKYVESLGMNYIHIPLANVKSITRDDAQRLHTALEAAGGPVLLHCTVGWRAAGLLAIERHLFHDLPETDAIALASKAHMSHASEDVKRWLEKN